MNLRFFGENHKNLLTFTKQAEKNRQYLLLIEQK